MFPKVEYFPRTVLTGAVGAIGISLFLLGLELTIPTSSPPLNLTSAGSVLFGRSHVSLLLASFLPAFFLSLSIRSTILRRFTFGATKHMLYIPFYLPLIAGIFWTVVRATGHANPEGMAMLAARGWLFSVPKTKMSGRGWVYWKLFDFKKIEWWAMKGAITDMVLLIVFGLVNLPIKVPTLALSLDMSYNMDHELIGHGASNIFAGMLGTVPNLVVSFNPPSTAEYFFKENHRSFPTQSSSPEQEEDGSKPCSLFSSHLSFSWSPHCFFPMFPPYLRPRSSSFSESSLPQKLS